MTAHRRFTRIGGWNEVENLHTNRKKVGFIASAGGHWEELLCLKEIADRYDSFFVTERAGRPAAEKQARTYYFAQINRREPLFLVHFAWVCLCALRIVLRERPDAVIATGALLSFPFCLCAKLCGKKVIYIESAARVREASLTGKLVSRFADLFFVQWESLLRCYPKAVYAGRVF